MACLTSSSYALLFSSKASLAKYFKTSLLRPIDVVMAQLRHSTAFTEVLPELESEGTACAVRVRVGSHPPPIYAGKRRQSCSQNIREDLTLSRQRDHAILS